MDACKLYVTLVLFVSESHCAGMFGVPMGQAGEHGEQE
jgi:hypothetical protein